MKQVFTPASRSSRSGLDDHDSYHFNTPSSMMSASNAAATSPLSPSENVLRALKMLQSQRKTYETDIDNSLVIIEELKANIETTQRSLLQWKTEHHQTLYHEIDQIQTSSDKVNEDIKKLYLKLDDYNDVYLSSERFVTTQNENVTAHKGGIEEIHKHIESLIAKNRKLREELRVLELGNDNLTKNLSLIHLPTSAFNSEASILKKQIDKLLGDIKSDQHFADEACKKSDSLCKYLNLLLSVNDDLCNAVTAQEKTNDIFLQVNGQFAHPRYSWGKESLPITEVMKIVKNAAQTSASSVAAINASKNVQKLVRSLRFGGDPSEALSYLQDASDQYIRLIKKEPKLVKRETKKKKQKKRGNKKIDQAKETRMRAKKRQHMQQHVMKAPSMSSDHAKSPVWHYY